MTGNSASMARMHRQRNRFIVALGVFLLIAAGICGYLLPHYTGVRHAARDARENIDDLRIRLRDVMAQKERNQADRARYAQYRREGFLGMQDRLAAARILDDLRIRYRISSLDYQIDPVSAVNISRPQESSGLDLSESRIFLNLRGFLDSDLNGFLEALMREMPGHITVRSVEISKLATPDLQTLARLRRGEDAALVGGGVELLWRTLQDGSENQTP